MFDVGKDIFKRGFTGIRGDGAGRGRMHVVYWWLRLAFFVFIGWTLYLGISGTDNTRRAVTDGSWAVHRADIIDRNGGGWHHRLNAHESVQTSGRHQSAQTPGDSEGQ